jgi:hypothetical protein
MTDYYLKYLKYKKKYILLGGTNPSVQLNSIDVTKFINDFTSYFENFNSCTILQQKFANQTRLNASINDTSLNELSVMMKDIKEKFPQEFIVNLIQNEIKKQQNFKRFQNTFQYFSKNLTKYESDFSGITVDSFVVSEFYNQLFKEKESIDAIYLFYTTDIAGRNILINKDLISKKIIELCQKLTVVFNKIKNLFARIKSVNFLEYFTKTIDRLKNNNIKINEIITDLKNNFKSNNFNDDKDLSDLKIIQDIKAISDTFITNAEIEKAIFNMNSMSKEVLVNSDLLKLGVEGNGQLFFKFDSNLNPKYYHYDNMAEPYITIKIRGLPYNYKPFDKVMFTQKVTEVLNKITQETFENWIKKKIL